MAEDRKPYNPCVTRAYPDDRWKPEGSIVSLPLDAEAVDTLVKNIRIGCRILIKNTKLPAKFGGTVRFIEVVSPNPGAGTPRPSSRGPLDD